RSLLVVLLCACAWFAAAPRAWAEGGAATVRAHERVAFALKVARGGQTAADRASAASHALEAVIEEGEAPDTRVEERDGSAVTIGLGLVHLFAQIAIGYGWLLIALSLFTATRGYTERLTGFVLTPLWALLGRLGSALPILVVAGIAALAASVLVRFVALFFE